ncbi:hypothetical protein J132_02341 [Termitomyces sp. J132]|nr:hypothetical protein J132_02341 [Termitomyces sp. J132]
MYRREEFQLRVGIFYASASLSGAFGGLLATAIIKMEGVGGLAGWKWIYILEGLATIIASLVSASILPADLSSARFLTEEERAFAYVFDTTTTTSGHNDKKDVEPFELREVIRGLTDIQTWLTGIAYLGLIVSLYSYSLFLPTIVSGLGYSGGAAQLHTVPPYVPAVVLTVVVAVLSDQWSLRGPFILICLPFTIIGNDKSRDLTCLLSGYILAITAQTNAIRYVAVFFMASGIYPSAPCILSILPNNSSGYFKKATTTALQLAIDQAPKYIRGHSIVLGFIILSYLSTAANVCYCLWKNKARKEGRREINLEKYQRLWNAGKTRAPIGDRHPKFLFTL